MSIYISINIYLSCEYTSPCVNADATALPFSVNTNDKFSLACVKCRSVSKGLWVVCHRDGEVTGSIGGLP